MIFIIALKKRLHIKKKKMYLCTYTFLYTRYVYLLQAEKKLVFDSKCLRLVGTFKRSCFKFHNSLPNN